MGVIVKEKVKGSGEWWVFVHHKGRKKTKKIGDYQTAEQVAKKIRARLALEDFGFMAPKKEPALTFKEAAGLWLAEPQDWRESTREAYIFNLEKHVFPKIGKIPIYELTRKKLKTFFNGLINTGKASSTVAGIRAPIQGILSWALDEEWIEFNPLQNVIIKTKKKKDAVRPLTDLQADRFLDQARRYMDGYYYPHFLCLVRSGIRLGELQALTWDDIDHDGRTLDINRSFRMGRFTEPKNHKARRVDITPRLAIGDVSYQLGHSSIKITYDIYGHWMPGKFKNEVDELDISTAPDCPQGAPKNESI